MMNSPLQNNYPSNWILQTMYMISLLRPFGEKSAAATGTTTTASCARSLGSTAHQLYSAIARAMFTVYSSLSSSPGHREIPKSRSGFSPAGWRVWRQAAKRCSAIGAALLLSLGLFPGGVQSAGAGTIVVTFTDDGSTSTITSSGSLDMSGFNLQGGGSGNANHAITLPTDPNRNVQADTGWYQVSSNRGTFGEYRRDDVAYTVSGYSTFTGKKGNDSLGRGDRSYYMGDDAYSSNLYLGVRGYGWRGVSYVQITASTPEANRDTLVLSGRKATFDKTLSERYGDNDFHIVFQFDGQNVIYTTKTAVPASPEDVTANRSDGQVTLNWTDPKDMTVLSYQYQQKAADGEYGEWTPMEGSETTTTSHTIEGLTNGESYTFRIRAVNHVGNGPDSNEANVSPLAPGAPDAAELTASADRRTAVLTWTHAGDTSITKWQYQQREGDTSFGSEWKDVPGSGAATRSYTVDQLTGGHSYGFRVRAVNDAGNGVMSNVATVGTPVGPTPEMESQAAKMVLSELGRVTIAGATDIIDERLRSAPLTNTLMLGGQLIGGETSMKDPVASHKATGWWQGNRATEGYSSSIEEEQLLDGSAFALSLSGEDAVDGNPGITVWGRGDFRNFQGVSGNDSWDGSVKSAWVGIDNWANERLLAGVAVSRNRGEVDLLTLDVNSRVETSLTAIWPYMQMTLPSGTGTVRVVVGIGSGEAEHRPEEGEDSKAGLSMKAASVGARWAVANQGQVTISVPVEAEVVRLRTRGDASTAIGGLSIKSWRVRSGVEFAHAGLALSDSGWVLLPRGSLSLRQDGGDGITGRGVEIGGGFGLYSPDSRMSLDASGHWLARHAAAGQREWGASIGVQFAPDSQGHGWSGSLRQEWGVQQEGILSDDTLFQNGTGGQVTAPGSLAARAGYGFGVMEGLMTVSADARLATGDEEVPHYGAGLEFTLPRGLTATLRGEHVETTDPDTRIGAGIQLRF